MKKKNKIIEIPVVNLSDYYSFKSPTTESMDYVANIVFNSFAEAKSVEYEQFNLYLKNATVIDNEEKFKKVLFDIINDDYETNLVESIEQGWEFVYFVNQLDIKDDVLCITVQLSYPEPTDVGSSYYSMYILKHKNLFYVWPF